jgi:tRNA threonylcarbamoyladenosine biosynthesis protein TsaB
MLLLAVDSSGKNGSIALARCGTDGACTPFEPAPLAGGTFSAQLIPQIAALLDKHGFAKSQLDAFAVVSGPGSFTGLRVGLGAIKALAEVLHKPIATVSLLEAVAASAPKEFSGKVLAVLDASRGEFYAGEYEVSASGMTMLSERLLPRAELITAAIGACVITPDGSAAEAARKSAAQVVPIPAPRADTIARLAWPKILAGQTVTPDALEANYIRRSDAELFFKPK